MFGEYQAFLTQPLVENYCVAREALRASGAGSGRGCDWNEIALSCRRGRFAAVRRTLEHFFDDELTCGSKGLHPKLLRQVEPFPTKEAVPYDAGYLAGFVVDSLLEPWASMFVRIMVGLVVSTIVFFWARAKLLDLRGD